MYPCNKDLNQRKGKGNSQDDDLVKTFAKFMRQGKVRAAVRLLWKHEAGERSDAHGELTVLEELIVKDPNKAPIVEEAIVTDCPGKEPFVCML